MKIKKITVWFSLIMFIVFITMNGFDVGHEIVANKKNVMNEKENLIVLEKKKTIPNDSLPIEKKSARDDKLEESHPLSVSKNLARAIELRKYVLPTQMQRAEFRSLLMNKAMIEEMVSMLENPKSEFDSQDIDQRMKVVDYFGSALAWDGNPARGFIMKELETYLTDFSVDKKNYTKVARKSIAGDKVELYGLMAMKDPKWAQEMLKKVKGTSNERLFKFAISYFQLPSFKEMNKKKNSDEVI